MVKWSGGAIYGLIWGCIFLPLSIILTIFFYLRRDKQPIKARSPVLVVLTDLVLIAWVFLLCLQRILGDSYPCYLNLWSGYIGLIVLFNTYLWRCWTLYFTFNLTQQMLNNVKTWNRYYVSSGFLGKIAAVTFFVLVPIPCIILTLTSDAIKNQTGDNCDLDWGRVLLAVYVAVYAAIFLIFAWGLRAVVDGFKIKTELKFTGAIAIAAVIPWLLFNDKYKTQNADIFPFSTLALLVAVVFAFGASTLWPLFRSIYKPPQVDLDVPENLDHLHALILSQDGFESFRRFLTSEFSVENLLFWVDIEDLRTKVRTKGPDDAFIKTETKRLYNKYVMVDSPFQVNLADYIVQAIEFKMRKLEEENILDTTPMETLKGNAPNEFPTIFDEAQKSIFNLMDADSFQRYKSSDLYRDFVRTMRDKSHKKNVLQEMNIV